MVHGSDTTVVTYGTGYIILQEHLVVEVSVAQSQVTNVVFYRRILVFHSFLGDYFAIRLSVCFRIISFNTMFVPSGFILIIKKKNTSTIKSAQLSGKLITRIARKLRTLRFMILLITILRQIYLQII